MWQDAITHMHVLYLSFLEVEFISKSAKLRILLLNRMSTS